MNCNGLRTELSDFRCRLFVSFWTTGDVLNQQTDFGIGCTSLAGITMLFSFIYTVFIVVLIIGTFLQVSYCWSEFHSGLRARPYVTERIPKLWLRGRPPFRWLIANREGLHSLNEWPRAKCGGTDDMVILLHGKHHCYKCRKFAGGTMAQRVWSPSRYNHRLDTVYREWLTNW